MSRCMKTNVENATDGRNRNNGMVNPGGGLYSWVPSSSLQMAMSIQANANDTKHAQNQQPSLQAHNTTGHRQTASA